MAKHPAEQDSLNPHPTSPRSSTDGAHEPAERHERGELIPDQGGLTGEETAAVIPFPSDEAQAADGRPDPQTAREGQGDAGHASAEQRQWCFRARQRGAEKKPRKRWDWSEFKNVRERFTPEERLEREIARYRKDKLLSSQGVQPPDTAATIIPFPSDQAPAAGGSDDPPDDA